MAKNELTTGKTSKFRDINSIMKDPAARAKLTNLVDEAVTCKGAIQMQQQNIKVLRETALDDVQISPKLFNALVAASFNNDYAQRKDNLEEQVTMLEHIMGSMTSLDSNEQDLDQDE